MNAQLHLASRIVAGRAWSDQEHAQLRDVALARQDDRKARRQGRRVR